MKWKDINAVTNYVSRILSEICGLQRAKLKQLKYQMHANGRATCGVELRTSLSVLDRAVLEKVYASIRYWIANITDTDTTGDDLNTPIELGSEAKLAIINLCDAFLEKRQDKLIIHPLRISTIDTNYVMQNRYVIKGRYAQRSDALEPDRVRQIEAKIESYSRPARSVTISLKGSDILSTLGFDEKKHLQELREKCCDDNTYQILVKDTRDVKNRPITVLSKILSAVDVEVPLIDEPH